MSFTHLLDRRGPGFAILDDNRVFWRTNSLLMYNRCPLYFKLFMDDRKQQGEPAMDIAKDHALINGIITHRAVEFLIRAYLFGLNGKTDAMLLEVINHAKEEILSAAINKEYAAQNLKDVYEYGFLAKKAVQEILSLNDKIVDVETIHVIEKPEYVIKLTPDVLLQNTVVDLKTTSKPLDRIYIYNDYKLQLEIYANMLHMDRVALVFISFADTKVKTVQISRSMNYDEIDALIKRCTVGVVNERFEPKKGKYCSYCKYRDRCPLV